MTIHLLPCPFCGSTDLEIYCNEYGCKTIRYDGYVECNTCDASGPRLDVPAVEVIDGKRIVRDYADVKEMLANKWNVRVSVAADIVNMIISKSTETTDGNSNSS